MVQPDERPPRIPDPSFRRAVHLLDAGEVDLLHAQLEAEPALLSQRVEIAEYAGGYFETPYLLWFTAENPIRNGVLPRNIVDVVEAIVKLARRFEIESLSEQLDYTLSLVCSGRVVRECGLQLPMVAALVGRGACPDSGMGAALSHRELEAARALLAHGAEADLPVCSALGLKDDLQSALDAAPNEERFIALGLAAFNGQAAIVDLLLRNGVDPNRYNPEGFHAHATPLHNAVIAGQIDVVRVLLDHGADATIRDRIFNGDAFGWARHAERYDILELLEDAR